MNLGKADPARARLHALTGLRFFAAMIVVLFHIAPDRLQFLPAVPANIVGAGYVAVSLFFVLSGYILAYNYVPDPTLPAVPKRQFWVARVARIYPVYAVAMLLALPPFLFVLHRQTASSWDRLHDGTRVVGLSLIMVQAWVPSLAYRMNWPSWSLSTEAFFYLLFPFLVPLASRSRVRRHPVLACALLWIASMTAVTALLAFAKTPAGSTWLSRDDWASALVYTPILRLPEFLLGVVLGLAYPAHVVAPRTGRALTLGSLALLGVLLANSPFLPQQLLRTGLLMPIFGALVLGLAASDGPLARFLSRSSLLLLGEASYALYILHTPIHAWLRATDLLDGGRLFASPLWAPLYIVIVVSVSIITLKKIEMPARHLVRRWLAPTTSKAKLAMSTAETLGTPTTAETSLA